jgi:antitoxin ParD1/3/4
LAKIVNDCQNFYIGVEAMATMNISLPDQMKEWVEAQAESGRYSNASDYVRDLIRRDQERDVFHKELQAAVDVGVASGIGSRTMEALQLNALERLKTRAAISEADQGAFISANAIHRWMEQLDKNPNVEPPKPDIFVRRAV